MTRIDFYVLQADNSAQRALFACRLAEKAYQMGRKVYIHTADGRAASELDKLLWTFKQDSFIPHGIQGEPPSEEAPVVIGYQNDLPADHQARDVLINLHNDVPLFFSSFERVAEVIDQTAEQKQQGRERFRFYRDRGYTMETHQLG